MAVLILGLGFLCGLMAMFLTAMATAAHLERAPGVRLGAFGAALLCLIACALLCVWAGSLKV